VNRGARFGIEPISQHMSEEKTKAARASARGRDLRAKENLVVEAAIAWRHGEGTEDDLEEAIDDLLRLRRRA
jgi:hypothetical protein